MKVRPAFAEESVHMQAGASMADGYEGVVVPADAGALRRDGAARRGAATGCPTSPDATSARVARILHDQPRGQPVEVAVTREGALVRLQVELHELPE